MNNATERWMWCLFFLGPHIFHSRQNLNSCATGFWLRTEIPRVWGLSCTLATARMLQLAKGLKRRARCQDQSVVWCSTLSLSSAQSGSAQSWGLHAEPPSSASKLGMWSLCEKHKKNSSSLAVLFLFSSWDLKTKTRGKGIQKSFYTSYSWNWWFMPGLNFPWKILQAVAYCLFFTCCHGQTGE